MTLSSSPAPPADGQILTRRDGASVVVTLSRAARANAYTQSMLDGLLAAIDAADADTSVRVIVITGEGDRAFSAGADLRELAERDWRDVVALKSESVFARVGRSRAVTIAAINGAAVGGGLELALSCDLRLATKHATFRLPEPAFGVLPAAGGTALLPQLVGPLRAKELILGGAEWTADTALSAGLVTEVIAAEDLWARVADWVSRIASRDAHATALAKQAIDAATSAGGGGYALLAQSLLARGRAEVKKD